ncbi:UNVERIFIED_CONTAM: hypothetical protein NY603_25050, partial [Bacteroidetes bacterium 56_B9]
WLLAIMSQPLPRQFHSPLLSPVPATVSTPRIVETLTPWSGCEVTTSSILSVFSFAIDGDDGSKGVY